MWQQLLPPFREILFSSRFKVSVARLAMLRLCGQKSQASHSSAVGQRHVSYGALLRLISQTRPKRTAGAIDSSFFTLRFLRPDSTYLARPLKLYSMIKRINAYDVKLSAYLNLIQMSGLDMPAGAVLYVF
jgi:hypothetical protein